MKLQGFFASDVQFYIALTASYSFFRNNPDTLQVNRLTVYYCKSETCSDNNSYTPTKWFIRFPAGASPAESVITQKGDVLESVWEDDGIQYFTWVKRTSHPCE